MAAGEAGAREIARRFFAPVEDQLEDLDRRESWRGEAFEALFSELLNDVGRLHEVHVQDVLLRPELRPADGDAVERWCARVAARAAQLAHLAGGASRCS